MRESGGAVPLLHSWVEEKKSFNLPQGNLAISTKFQMHLFHFSASNSLAYPVCSFIAELFINQKMRNHLNIHQ